MALPERPTGEKAPDLPGVGGSGLGFVQIELAVVEEAAGGDLVKVIPDSLNGYGGPIGNGTGARPHVVVAGDEAVGGKGIEQVLHGGSFLPGLCPRAAVGVFP